MANYSGTIEEQKAKRKAYDKLRQSSPEYRERQRLRRQTPEYKAIVAAALKKYRATEEYKAKKRAYRAMQKHKDKRRDTMLREKFGMTLGAYNAMLDKQAGVCAICYRDDAPRSLAVDHCHTTGRIRGLLCRACNVSIGLFEDSPDALQRAIEYLR